MSDATSGYLNHPKRNLDDVLRSRGVVPFPTKPAPETPRATALRSIEAAFHSMEKTGPNLSPIAMTALLDDASADLITAMASIAVMKEGEAG